MNFSQKVYKLTKKIPTGKITTYKEIARVLNCKAYRAVGQALKRNPNAPIIPCHRVVAVDGSIGGFGGKTRGIKIKKKEELLKKEGINMKNNKIYNFNKLLFRYN